MPQNFSTGKALYDVIIVGGGPAGLSAATYAARRKLKTLVLDKSPYAGALGIAESVENYPGVLQKMKGIELLSIFRKQAQQFGAQIIASQVIGVGFTQELKEVITSEETYRGKTVIIATGAMGRKPSIKGEAELLGRGVSYCATCDAPFFKDKSVAVIGRIEEAIEEVDVIAKFANRIYLITSTKTIDPTSAEIIHRNPIVEVKFGYRVLEIFGNNLVEGICVADSEGNKLNISVAGAFVYLHGNQPIVDFLYDAVKITSDGCIEVNLQDMSTSIAGVYAVGDVTCKQIRQIVITAAEGCTAALAANKFINQWQHIHPE